MAPELKIVVSDITELTCSNCVFSTPSASTPDRWACNHTDAVWKNTMQASDVFMWGDILKYSNDFCSQGQWLFRGSWLYDAEDEPKLHVFEYLELYDRFAKRTLDQ